MHVQNLSENYIYKRSLSTVPLKIIIMLKCQGDVTTDTLPVTPKGNNEIEWNLASVEIGFRTVIGPRVFWNKWRKW